MFREGMHMHRHMWNLTLCPCWKTSNRAESAQEVRRHPTSVPEEAGLPARGRLTAATESLPSSPVPPTMMLGYLDLAIRGTLEYERYAHVYLSPWWELPDVPEGSRAWKRAVLERIPLRGAEHWGHLYLLVRRAEDRSRRLSVFGRSWNGAVVAESPGEERFTLRRGEQVAELIAHPSRPERAEQLRAFASELEQRFRRQMD